MSTYFTPDFSNSLNGFKSVDHSSSRSQVWVFSYRCLRYERIGVIILRRVIIIINKKTKGLYRKKVPRLPSS